MKRKKRTLCGRRLLKLLSKYDIKGDLEITSLDQSEERLFVKPKVKYGVDLGRMTHEQYRSMVESYRVFGTSMQSGYKVHADLERQMKKLLTFGHPAGMRASKLAKMMSASPAVSRAAQVLMIDDVHQIAEQYVNYPLTSAPEGLTKNLQDWFTGNLLHTEKKT